MRLLADLLKLPPGFEVVAVSDQLFFHENVLAVRVRSEQIRPMPENHSLPVICPQFKEVRKAEFDGWIDFEKCLKKE